jgi:MFS family permease
MEPMELDTEDSSRRSSRRQLVPARYRLAWLCFFAAFFGYSQRYGLALAIVRMQAELDWDRSTQGRVLAAFFLGYMLAQLPAGYIAARVGPRKSIAVGIFVSSLLNLLLPAAATKEAWAWWLVSALRVLQGLAQGILFPGFAALWSRWAPPIERSRLDGIPRAGGFCGAMACNAIGGLQCESTLSPWLFGGWQGVVRRCCLSL